MEIEWVTFVESVTAEGAEMILKAPGADSIFAKHLPADIPMWAVASLRINYHELVSPEVSHMRVEVREAAFRQVVNTLDFIMAAPTIVSPSFHQGHSGRIVKAFDIEFPATSPGWYEVDFRLDDGDVYPMVLFVGETP
jgi:hypothetical protein